MTRDLDVIHDRGGVSGRDDMMGRGFHCGGLSRGGRHWIAVRSRGRAVSAERIPPRGRAGVWSERVRMSTPFSGIETGRQLARLCGDDIQVTLPWRSLADAVGRRD